MITGLFVGFLLGFVLQRGRFCVVGAYRDLFLTKKATIFIALFIVIALQSVGVWILHDLGIIAFKNREFYWLSTIIGGIIFGFGMVIAGGCATGTWYRAGEGLVGSIVALFCYALGAAMTKYGALHFIQENLNVYTTRDSMIFQTLNVSPWVLVIVLCLATLFFALKELSKPKLKIARLKPKKEGISHILFEKAWHPFVTAILVAIIAIVAWVLSTWSGRADGLGITTPSANLMMFLTTGNTGIVDWGVFLVLGIVFGIAMISVGISTIRYSIRTSSLENLYESELKKILNHYSAYIQQLGSDFDFKDYQILKIDTFEDMLEIRDTIKQPILMKENEDKTGAYFLIPSNTKILYVYRIKIGDISE